jgi:hypothetical protein
MARYYRGAGIRTHWHSNDARTTGFSAAQVGTPAGQQAIINHVSFALTDRSPYISMTRSYEVAEHYAKYFGHEYPSAGAPAFVYEIEFDPVPDGLQLYDPVIELAKALPSPLAPPPFYQHNGAPDVLLGIVNRSLFGDFLLRAAKNPGIPTGAPPQISDQLIALVRALRDAEVLAYNSIPQNCVRQRYDIHSI